eukprot:TRINITY_DN27672_c0_g1_i1.p1 TRINITY_DN27672_c0_g1~~TRINITY_DN27672_c0_g1_i1.p1  ORF type:complete len:486 (-),score=39.05 TRINITY_DN27672_c0_g1_i1:49-1419(-)
MAPAASKSVPPPPANQQDVAVLVDSMVRRVSTAMLEILETSLRVRDAFVCKVGEKIDGVLRYASILFESCSCMPSLSNFIHGPKFPPMAGATAILFILLIIAMLYSAFVFCYLPAAGLGLNSALSLSFHAIMFLLLSSFVGVAQTDGGGVPHETSWRDFCRPPTNLREQSTRDGGPRWCVKCKCYKPDRAHHCKVEGRCILRMDHHCPWVGNTIGFFNHKYFLLLLFYADAACCTLGFSIIQILLTHAVGPLMKFLLLGAGCLSAELLFVLFPFFVFQLYLLARNRTTIEYREGRGGKTSCYDAGLYKNVAHVMGDNPLLWLFPVGGPSGDGLSFPASPEFTSEVVQNSCAVETGPDASEEGGEWHGDTSTAGESVQSDGSAWTYVSGLSIGCQTLWDSAGNSLDHVKNLCFTDGSKKRKQGFHSGSKVSRDRPHRARCPTVSGEIVHDPPTRTFF